MRIPANTPSGSKTRRLLQANTPSGPKTRPVLQANTPSGTKTRRLLHTNTPSGSKTRRLLHTNTPSGTKKDCLRCPPSPHDIYPQNTKPPNERGIAPHSPSGGLFFIAYEPSAQARPSG